MTFELGRSLLLSGAVTTEKLSEALYAAATQGIALGRALIGLGAIDEDGLERELAETMPLALTRVVPAADLMELLPAGLCHTLAVVPLRMDEAGVVDVAVLDPKDGHGVDEVRYHLNREVRAHRASYAAMREALETYPVGLRALAAPMGRPSGGPSRPSAGPPVRVSVPAPVPMWAPARVLDDPEEGRFTTRSWDSFDYEALSAEEASWDAEPVFELRRLGPPPTVPDPEPVTIRIQPEQAGRYAIGNPAPRRETASSHPAASKSAPPLAVPLAPGPSAPPVVVPSPAPALPRNFSTASLGPSAPAPPYPDLGTSLAGIRAAEDRDAVLGLVLLGARTVARRVALLVIRKDGLTGWSCTPEFGDENALKELKIPLRAPNLLTAILSGGVHLGPLMGTVAAPLLRVMKTASHDVAIAPIRVADRAAVLLVADELGDTLLATKRIDELARAAGDALVRILRAKMM